MDPWAAQLLLCWYFLIGLELCVITGNHFSFIPFNKRSVEYSLSFIFQSSPIFLMPALSLDTYQLPIAFPNSSQFLSCLTLTTLLTDSLQAKF